MQFKRTSGILMPISSLPGNYGIGTLGAPAHKFVDFLAKAGQSIWQILPVNPTGYGDSPYQSCSAFAGNPYLIDLDILAKEGLLKKADFADEDWYGWGADETHIGYGALYEKRYVVLRKAYANFLKKRPVAGYDTPYGDDYYAFTLKHEAWLTDYCLYMAIKQKYKMADWQKWDRPLRLRESWALEQFKAENAEEIGFWEFLQYEFYKQWEVLHTYAAEHGVSIMGDIPIYVSADSADAWAGRELFEMDSEGHPTRVSGCPPDYFSADGQLWGNPLYDWNYHKQSGYAWWIRRVRHALTTYDILRIDHFRGFDTYWAIPADAKTARNGKWETGPRMDLFNALRDALGDLPIVAEDLGELFDSVRELLKESTFPGMKVLQFGVDGKDNEHLPHNHPANCIAYPGTHDNNTLAGWLKEDSTAAQRKELTEYFHVTGDETLHRGILRGVMSSPASIAIIPMADWLEAGADARLNTPGKASGNWGWRAEDGVFTAALAKEIKELTRIQFRTNPPMGK